jgi:hypothetical protein
MSFRVCFCFAVFAAVASGFVAQHTALSVRIGAHRDECFYEDVTSANTKVFFHFAVTNGGALDIDAAVYGPDGQLIWSCDKEIEGRILFKSKMPGPHKFCFGNKMSSVTTKTVAFAIQSGERAELDGKRTSDPMQKALGHIADGLTEIKNEQNYLRARERIHRETAESTNTRVLTWSFLEMLLIVGLSGAQIMYLVSRFEKRRNV